MISSKRKKKEKVFCMPAATDRSGVFTPESKPNMFPLHRHPGRWMMDGSLRAGLRSMVHPTAVLRRDQRQQWTARPERKRGKGSMRTKEKGKMRTKQGREFSTRDACRAFINSPSLFSFRPCLLQGVTHTYYVVVNSIHPGPK